MSIESFTYIIKNTMIRRVVYIISIERYNGKEKVNIELKNESDIHFKTIFFAKRAFILK